MQLGRENYLRSQRWKLTGDGQFYDMIDTPFRQIVVPDDTSDVEAKAGRERRQAALKDLAPPIQPAKRTKKAK